MTVVVDIGNTRVKWASTDNGTLRGFGEVVHVESPDQALSALAEAIAGQPKRIVVANVAGEVMASRLVAFAVDRWGVEPEFVEPRAGQSGVRCGYRDPLRLGADRWAAVIAAYHLSEKAACVIDAGTTVTLDVVDESGLHRGGIIMAGPRIIASALHRETVGIGMTAGAPDGFPGSGPLGRSTDEAVAYGAMLGLAGAVERVLAWAAKELGQPTDVYLTGGDGPALLPWLETRPQCRANLVLEGLAVIAADS